MKIGIIGNGTHSKRIQKILTNKKLNFLVYKPAKPKYFDFKEFQKIKKCKIIFIVSPDSTHFKYIKKLYKNRYIFCEKPPANNKNELTILKKLKLEKVFFNFNFRFLKISEIFKNRNKYKLGNLIYANIISSHGLALKKEYKKNWRSNIKKSPKGIFEIVSIHYIDLINYHFNVKKINKPKLFNLSKVGNGFDTSSVEIELKNKAIVSIFTTYTSAYAKKFFFLFENGIIEQDENTLSIRGPSINIDKKGFFKKAKLKKKIIINQKKDTENSLYKSINFFFSIAHNKKTFQKRIVECSLKSNSLIV